MTDDEMIQGVMAGDAGAFEEFYTSTKAHVERVASFFVGDDESMPAVVVGGYKRAFDQLALGKKPDIPLRSWLSILTVQEAFHALKALRVQYDAQTTAMENVAGQVPALQEITQDPKERVAYMVRGDIDDMPDPHKQLMMMNEIEGLSLLELSKRLSCSWSVAVSRLMLARQVLVKRVKEQFGL